MGKNNLFSKLFGNEAKGRKLLSKLKKMKKEYDILDKKLMDGKINNKELNQYTFLKEEIKKMAKKFTLKDGKFVLKNNEEQSMDNTNNNATAAPQPIVEQQPQQVVNTQQDEVMRQAQAQQEAQLRAQAQQEAQLRAQAQQEAQLRAQAQQEAQLRAQAQQEAQLRAQAQQEAQLRAQAQQEAQLRAQAQQEAQHNNLITVYLTITDMPELSLGIMEHDVQEFVKNINKSMIEGLPFEFGPSVVNGSKILMYRFN